MNGPLVAHNDEARLAEALRRAGVEIGSVGGDHFRRVVANRLLNSEWLARYVERIVAARVAAVEAERDRLAAGVRALADEWQASFTEGRTLRDEYGNREGVTRFTTLDKAAARLRSLLGAAETTGGNP